MYMPGTIQDYCINRRYLRLPSHSWIQKLALCHTMEFCCLNSSQEQCQWFKHLPKALTETRVISRHTYPARLFVMNTLQDTPDQFWVRMHVVDLLTINTTCDFERGRAKKPIIERTTLTYGRYMNLTFLNAPATLLKAFFKYFLPRHTHTHRHRRDGITLPLLSMRAHGN